MPAKAAKNPKLKAAWNRAMHGKKSGDQYFELVFNALRIAHHKGAMNGDCDNPSAWSISGYPMFPDSSGEPQDICHLVNAFFQAVLWNRPNEIRRIAGAVTRVHSRKEFVGDRGDLESMFPFSCRPAKPVIANLIKNSAGSTLATKAREIAGAAADFDHGISDRSARRLRKALGLKPCKRGRPKVK
jgi:hypothetical protein